MENLADLLGFALLIFSLLAYLFFRHRPKMKGVTKALRTFGRAATTQIWLSANRPHIRSNYGQVDDSIRRRLWNVLPGLVLLEENGSSTSGSGVTIASYTGRVLASVEQGFTGPQVHCK